MLSIVMKVITNKTITLYLILENVIFYIAMFCLPITNPIILGSDFLDTHFTVLDIGNCTITLHCVDYILTTSLAYNPVYIYNLAKIIVLVATRIFYI